MQLELFEGGQGPQQLGRLEDDADPVQSRPGGFGDAGARVEDGVSVTLSNQMWFGVAASLGLTAISALRNPLSLFSRIDDIAQDVESLQLEEGAWGVIDQTARQHGTGKRLSERLSSTVCPYCLTANPIASARCLACGAPLGEVQPATCLHCGFVVSKEEEICPNCRRSLP